MNDWLCYYLHLFEIVDLRFTKQNVLQPPSQKQDITNNKESSRRTRTKSLLIKTFLSCNFTASTNKSKVDLVLQIYMKLPQSLTNLTFSGGLLDTSSVSIYSNTSGVDTISHFLLLALASTQHGRNWTDQMREFEAAARKLAATHPLLLLRNLPLLAAGMKGRTDFDFSFFRYAFIISKCI